MYEILDNRVVFRIIGTDALSFLQNLCTNDINQNDYCYSYLLSNQGRYLFDFFIIKVNNNELWMDVEKGQLPNLIKKLTMHKLRAQVEFSQLPNCRIIYSIKKPDIRTIYSYQDPRYEKLGFRSIIEQDRAFQNDDTEIVDDLYRRDKYGFAIPDGDVDLIYDKSIPLEYGAKELKAVSYTKGCYLGQEVISRSTYQGVVRKKIFKITCASDFASMNENDITNKMEIIIDNQNIGFFCSIYKNQAIALIREEHYAKINQGGNTISIYGHEIKIEIPAWRIEQEKAF